MGIVKELHAAKEMDSGAAAWPTGWLEVDARWLAGLFGLQATGEVKTILGKVHIGVRHLSLTKGQVVGGQFITALVPTGFGPTPSGPPPPDSDGVSAPPR